jgi:hypothetical protein
MRNLKRVAVAVAEVVDAVTVAEVIVCEGALHKAWERHHCATHLNRKVAADRGDLCEDGG